MDDQITLTIDGKSYGGWTEFEAERGIDRCVSHFNIAVSERWATHYDAWRIKPFTPCTVSLGKDVILTGYVDDYVPQFTPNTHAVRIQGRSKTEDLVDCTPDIAGGQFSGYSLAAIARAICALFDIGVVIQTPQANQVVVNTQLQWARPASGSSSASAGLLACCCAITSRVTWC